MAWNTVNLTKKVDDLKADVAQARSELNTERTQRFSTDESLGMRFDNLIYYLDHKK